MVQPRQRPDGLRGHATLEVGREGRKQAKKVSIRRHNAARDANEPVIVDGLKAAGYGVTRLDTPCDLLVAKAGLTHCVEVKLPAGKRGGISGSKLTRDQKVFADRWGQWGCFHVVRGPEEAIAALSDCYDGLRGRMSGIGG